jgi:hypothetical protein
MPQTSSQPESRKTMSARNKETSFTIGTPPWNRYNAFFGDKNAVESEDDEHDDRNTEPGDEEQDTE